MAHISTAVEYGLHCLLYLVAERDGAPSTRDLADLQGVPADYVAKIFTRLQKAGLVVASEGVKGGMRLAKAAADISVFDVIRAIDGEKPLFDCREIRGNCALFKGEDIAWATRGVCSIHAIMIEADARMQDVLREHSLADIAGRVSAKAGPALAIDVSNWLDQRSAARRGGDAR